MNNPISVEKIYIDSAVLHEEIASNIQQNCGSKISVEIIEDSRDLLDSYRTSGVRGGDKRTIFIGKNQGKFLSSCPGSKGMICCRYFVLNTGVGCPYDCQYCYLQSFMNNSIMTMFGNISELFTELNTKLKNKNFHFRIGTGEYSDSLALEYLTGYAGILIRFFSKLRNATLELKTKSALIDSLLNLPHQGKTVISWSLNPDILINKVEKGTASLKERLNAAEKAQESGYRIAFHLDPLIHIDNWEIEYHRLIDSIFERIKPNNISWISIGSLRYSRALKEEIQTRFPQERITRAEMVQASDGKYRYFKTIREKMYQSIRNKLNSFDSDLFSYLCMETPAMWQRVYNFVPGTPDRLDDLFEKRRI